MLSVSYPTGNYNSFFFVNERKKKRCVSNSIVTNKLKLVRSTFLNHTVRLKKEEIIDFLSQIDQKLAFGENQIETETGTRSIS